MQSGWAGIFVDGGDEVKKLIPILIIFIYFMVGAILILMPSLVSAKLSDETLEMVERLSYKHYGHGTAINCIEITQEEMDMWEIQHQWMSIWFEDGEFFVETQDGKWFVEMEKVIK